MFEDGISDHDSHIEKLRQSCAFTIKYTDFMSSAERVKRIVDGIQLKEDGALIQRNGRLLPSTHI